MSSLSPPLSLRLSLSFSVSFLAELIFCHTFFSPHEPRVIQHRSPPSLSTVQRQGRQEGNRPKKLTFVRWADKRRSRQIFLGLLRRFFSLHRLPFDGIS